MEVFNLVLPWEEQILMPVGDIQYDSPGGSADLRTLAKHLAEGMERNALFLGMGDFIDFMSPSNRERYAGANLYDTARETIDRVATILEEELMHVLEPTRGRWIGLLQGHHFFEHLDGTSSDTRFAELLDTQYLGDSTMGWIRFREDQRNSASIGVFAHHGKTTTIKRLMDQKATHPQVRLFLQGHVPKLTKDQTTELTLTDHAEPVIVASDSHYTLCGGFARSFKQGSSFGGRAQGGYAEKDMMGPAVIGGPVITLTPEASYHGKHRRVRTVGVKISS